jgi:hypothetical protein
VPCSVKGFFAIQEYHSRSHLIIEIERVTVLFKPLLNDARTVFPLRSFGPGSGRAGEAYATGTAPLQNLQLDLLTIM